MKRFSAREFALLCVPVAAVAGAGCFASKPISPKAEPPPKLSFSMRQPSTLEAFDGVKTVLVAQVARDSDGRLYEFLDGKSYEPGATDPLVYPLVWLKIGDKNTSKIWRSDGSGSINKAAFKSSVLWDARVELPMKNVPPKPIFFGIQSKLTSFEHLLPHNTFDIKRQWPVDPSGVKPFDFSLDKAPLTHMKEMSIPDWGRSDKGGVESVMFYVEFTYDKPGENHNTPFEAQAKEKYGRLKWSGVDDPRPPAPQNWNAVIMKIERPASDAPPFEITGRVSANNRWPLAFKLGPFKFDDVKVGHPLPFQSWPAPLPPGVKSPTL